MGPWGCWAGKRWAGLKLEVGRTGNCDRCYTGIPTGISRIKNEIQQFGQENPSPDFDPVFAVFSRIFSRIRFPPKNTISGRLKRHSALVGTGISRSYFHPYQPIIPLQRREGEGMHKKGFLVRNMNG